MLIGAGILEAKPGSEVPIIESSRIIMAKSKYDESHIYALNNLLEEHEKMRPSIDDFYSLKYKDKMSSLLMLVEDPFNNLIKDLVIETDSEVGLKCSYEIKQIEELW
jgi:hypothetical protein